jgi:hypothetical protein
MQLREIFYLDKETLTPVEDERYDASSDTSIVKADDTRKTRLSLKDINRARRADDQHKKEKTKDLEHIRAMYGIQAQQTEEI